MNWGCQQLFLETTSWMTMPTRKLAGTIAMRIVTWTNIPFLETMLGLLAIVWSGEVLFIRPVPEDTTLRCWLNFGISPDSSALLASNNYVKADIPVSWLGIGPGNLLFERSKTCRLSKLPKLLGVLPLKWLLLRFNDTCKLPGMLGITPLSLFSLSWSSKRNFKLSMDVGMEPLRLLVCKFRKVILLNFVISNGIDPPWEFQLKFSIDNLWSWPISIGIAPLSLFIWSLKTWRLVILPSSDGNTPVKWFWAKFNIVIFLQDSNSTGIDLVKSLLSNSKYVKLGIAAKEPEGIFPLRWLPLNLNLNNFGEKNHAKMLTISQPHY